MKRRCFININWKERLKRQRKDGVKESEKKETKMEENKEDTVA